MSDLPESFHRGWRPGLIGEVAALHARSYAAEWGFGLAFEAKVAAGLADFLMRHDPTRDVVFSAWKDETLLGTVSIDGSGAQLAPGETQLRWFIVAEAARGTGLGARLLAAALGFSDGLGRPTCFLNTFAGLEAARRLYERAGFRLVSERTATTWGAELCEQRFERTIPGA